MSDAGDAFALTRSQQLIWTGQQLQPDEPLYNMALAFAIAGPLDVPAFERAFTRLVADADALRITFFERDGVPHQRVNAAVAHTLETVDLSGAADPLAAATAWQAERAQRQFDPTVCLFDACLLKLSPEHWVWFFNQHHLTTDAWSTSVLYRHMATLYAAAREDALADIAPLPSFLDYVRKEHAASQRPAAERARSYWREALATQAAPSSFYRSTPAQRSGRTRRVACSFGRERTAALGALTSHAPFAALTADLARVQVFATVYFAWLHRLGGERHLAIGTPTHNRSSASAKRTPGMFIEVFPLKVSIDDDDSFVTLNAKVARATRELLLNAPSGSTSHEHQRAFDVVLNSITARYGDFAGLPMTSTWVHADHGDRNHLVRLQVEDFDQSDELRVFFDVHDDVFDEHDVARAQRDFLTLFDAMLANPDQAVQQVSLLDEAATAHKLALGAADVTSAPPEHSVIERIDAVAARSGAAIAVRDGDVELTYAQLLAASSALAAELEAAGTVRGDRVAIALPRSAEAVVAMLAVQRVGAAYVPLDLAYPAARIASMLKDARPRVIVHGPAGRPEGAPSDAPGISLDTLVTDHAPFASRATPDDLAYIIYTSGSTGQPKGVQITHASLANYVDWAARTYHAGTPARWPLFSSLAFDLTVTSVFVPLADGGQVVVYRGSDGGGDLVIRDVIRDNQVDIVKLTPAHLNLVLPMDLANSRLRTLIVGGEDLKTALARSVSEAFGGRATLYNEYGPTEGTVACTFERFDPQANTGLSVPIGRPIDHAHIYIVDRNGQLLPRGAIGEIAIGGAGVARGYREREALTAERFVANPYRDGERMYLTGDLARWRDDGTLAYHGRRDDQVKVNGVRVELGDVEAALAAVPGVGAAAARLGDVEQATEETFCQRCGISGRHPNARLDSALICHICRVYEDERERALKYFGTLSDLRRIVDHVVTSAQGTPDSMMLLSGGKDSTYALCQLVDLGLTPLVFTLDNGFISEGAKINMQRVCERLGLELVVGTTPAMNEIFVDSLKRFSNVCNGCFKTIYTLSVNLARERGIRYIFTGLSRGQIFETRVADQFQQRIFDPTLIDRNIIEARKAYHRADDAVARHLDVSVFQGDDVFDEVHFVDFYRYTDVSLDEMYNYLGQRIEWVRPADTGRSTNCLINEAGIYVHKAERGFHNYSLPYSWDVRLGHKQRDAARDELDDRINVDNVRAILEQIGYAMPDSHAEFGARRRLVGYYTAPSDIDTRTLRSELARTLPQAVIPTQFVRLDELPLTQNGKVDRRALPDPDSLRPDTGVAYSAPDGVVERKLAAIWQQVLGVDRVGADDNFFDLGGDSILNIQIVASARKHGLTLQPQQIFEHATVRELARVVGNADQVRSEQGPITGDVPLAPIQARFFERCAGHGDDVLNHYNQNVLLTASDRINASMLAEALRQIVRHHDALRARYARDNGRWRQTFAGIDDTAVQLETVDLSADPAARHPSRLKAIRARLNASLSIFDGRLVAAALIERGHALAPWLLLSVHHLAVDGVSWWVLLEDLQSLYSQLRDGHSAELPPKTTSVPRFVRALHDYASADPTRWQRSRTQPPGAVALPCDRAPPGPVTARHLERIELTLNRDLTCGLLVDTATAWRAQAPDVLLGALAPVLCDWLGQTNVRVDVEHHGRENVTDDIDVLRTVGWFTSLCPVDLTHSGDDPANWVRAARQTLRTLPDNGLAYGAARYLVGDEQLAAEPPGALQFNYLGQWDRARAGGHWFSFAEPLTLSEAPDAPRDHALALDIIAFDGQLTLTFSYCARRFDAATIKGLCAAYRGALTRIVTAVRSGAQAALAATDFPSANLSQGELDDLLSDFGDEL